VPIGSSTRGEELLTSQDTGRGGSAKGVLDEGRGAAHESRSDPVGSRGSREGVAEGATTRGSSSRCLPRDLSPLGEGKPLQSPPVHSKSPPVLSRELEGPLETPQSH